MNPPASELAQPCGLAKAAARKVLAGLLFRLIRRQETQEAIESAALAEGLRVGLSRDEVCLVAVWVASQFTAREAA